MSGGQYIKPGKDRVRNTWLVIAPKATDGAGVLADILDIFKVRPVLYQLINFDTNEFHVVNILTSKCLSKDNEIDR